jgi:hypothetical protein
MRHICGYSGNLIVTPRTVHTTYLLPAILDIPFHLATTCSCGAFRWDGYHQSHKTAYEIYVCISCAFTSIVGLYGDLYSIVFYDFHFLGILQFIVSEFRWYFSGRLINSVRLFLDLLLSRCIMFSHLLYTDSICDISIFPLVSIFLLHNISDSRKSDMCSPTYFNPLLFKCLSFMKMYTFPFFTCQTFMRFSFISPLERF